MRQLVASALKAGEGAAQFEPPSIESGTRITMTLKGQNLPWLKLMRYCEGLNRSQWIKALVARRLGLKGRADESLRKTLGPVRKELRRIGINVNQALKIANAAMRDDKYSEVREQLDAVIELRLQINEQLEALASAMRGDYSYWKVPE